MKKVTPLFCNLLPIVCLCFALVICNSQTLLAQQAKSEKPPLNKELLDKYSGRLEIAYLVPRPAVIQKVLQGNEFTYTGQIKPNLTKNYSESIKIALNLGSRCTDGLMMTYGDQKATDSELQDLGTTIMKLTEDLGFKDELKTIDKLKLALKNKNQQEIKESMDLLFDESEQLLRTKGDNDLAMLVSLGGWTELMYYASEELSKNYQEESSKVLAMDYVVDVYIKALTSLKLFVQDSPTLSAIAEELPKIKAFMKISPNQPLSKDAVNGIYHIAKNLKQKIEMP